MSSSKFCGSCISFYCPHLRSWCPFQHRQHVSASNHFSARFQWARAKLPDCKWGKVTPSDPAEGQGITFRARKTAGAGNLRGCQSRLTGVLLPRGPTASSSWQSSLYLHNTQQSSDPGQSCWTLQQCKLNKSKANKIHCDFHCLLLLEPSQGIALLCSVHTDFYEP